MMGHVKGKTFLFSLIRLRSTRTIADAYDKGPDNFLLLRFIAAAMVLLGHSYAISGMPGKGDFIARANWGDGIYTGSIAVDMFFAISGFLVTASFVNRSNLEQFLKSRALRILPAYYACLVLSALVLGCMFTDMSLGSYLTSTDMRDYLIINPQFGADLRWELPGCLHTIPWRRLSTVRSGRSRRNFACTSSLRSWACWEFFADV